MLIGGMAATAPAALNDGGMTGGAVIASNGSLGGGIRVAFHPWKLDCPAVKGLTLLPKAEVCPGDAECS